MVATPELPAWALPQLDALRRMDCARRLIDSAALANLDEARVWVRAAGRLCEAAARDLDISTKCGAP